jgi:predicted NAD/FAD-binding protein
MRIAVVGSGIAGLGCAWLLGHHHEVTLLEANDYLGGHTHTHVIPIGSERYVVDTGFIVHNPRHYPLLTRLFAELSVDCQDTTMSFAVCNERGGLSYSTATLGSLFRRRSNLVSPRFYRMLLDIARFYRRAPGLLERADTRLTLGEYLESEGYSTAFRDDHLVPMAAALWSAPPAAVLSFPARFLVQFMANHEMLQLGARSAWKVVRGGSASYVRALQARWRVNTRLSCPVRAVRREEGAIILETGDGQARFDQVVLACHSDQALSLLTDPSELEQAVLGSMAYQRNEVVLHTDRTFLPSHQRDWAAWNALVPAVPTDQATVSYCMNVLQGLPSPEPLIVTLNPTRPVAPGRVLKRLEYAHPQFTPEALAAQAQRALIQGRRGTWFAGAYWGFGFHEDGLRSAVDVSRGLGVHASIAATSVPAPSAGSLVSALT